MRSKISAAASRYAILWIVLLALGLRMVRLLFQPLWWDEGWSLYFATTDVRSMLELTAVDIHPPLYYLLLHLWTGLFGPSVLSVRLLSVLIGTVAVLLIYLVGRRLLGELGGALAAFLLAVSPFAVYYSQEVRMYGLVMLLGLAAFYFALRWESERQGFGNLVGYVLAATAALYTQYYPAFLLLALNLIVLIRWARARRPFQELLPWLAAQVAVALLFLPWLLYAGEKLVTYVRFKIGVEEDLSFGPLTYLGRHLAAFNWGHAEGVLADWWWLGLLPLALLVVTLVFAWRKGTKEPGNTGPVRRQGIRKRGLVIDHWPLIILLVTLGCGFAVNLVFPFNPPRSERLLLLALPAYLLLFAGGVMALRRHKVLAALSLLAFLVLGTLSLAHFYTVPRYLDDDYRPLIERVRALGLPSDAVVNVHPWQVGYFQAYIPDDEARPTLFLTPREVIPRERQLWADDPVQMAADLDALLAEHGRLWLPDHQSMGRVLEEQIEGYLAQRAYHVFSEWHGENTVLSFFGTGQPQDQAVTAQFGEWLTLDSAALTPGPLESGWGVVATDLVWRVSERPDERHHVGLRLVDGAGRVWAQRDSTPGGDLAHFFEFPPGEPQLDRHGLLIPAGTPPGDYLITLRVYRSQDIAVLPVTFEGGSGGEVTLGTVRIVRPETPPSVEALNLTWREEIDFADRLKFLGYSIGNHAIVRPGEALEVELFWQTLAAPGEDFLPRLQLLDGNDVLAELTEKPVAGTYPTAWWKAGELVRDPHALYLPATVPAGSYPDLALSLIRASDGQPVEFNSGETIVRFGAAIEVIGREHNFWPTAPRYPQAARFGPSVELTGYDMREAVRAPGSPLEVTLHWHALEAPDRNYHTFVHLLDAEGEIVAQHDGPPGEGHLPTLGWLPGEYLTDLHLLRLPFELPDGVYQLGVGLYDPATGVRLGERVILATAVPVKARGGCNCR